MAFLNVVRTVTVAAILSLLFGCGGDDKNPPLEEVGLSVTQTNATVAVNFYLPAYFDQNGTLYATGSNGSQVTQSVSQDEPMTLNLSQHVYWQIEFVPNTLELTCVLNRCGETTKNAVFAGPEKFYATVFTDVASDVALLPEVLPLTLNQEDASLLADVYATEIMNSGGVIDVNFNVARAISRLSYQVNAESLTSAFHAITLKNALPEVTQAHLPSDIRALAGLIQLDEGRLNPKLDALTSELDTLSDGALLLEQSVNALDIAVNAYSPFDGSSAGTYQVDWLSVVYSTTPLMWQVTGQNQGVNVNHDLRILAFQRSAASGDLISASLSGQASNINTGLSINTAQFLVQFDGVEDVFNDTLPDTASAFTQLPISLIQGDVAFNGDVNVFAERFKPADFALTTDESLRENHVSGLYFNGQLQSATDNPVIQLSALSSPMNDINAAIAIHTEQLLSVPVTLLLYASGDELAINLEDVRLSIYLNNAMIAVSYKDTSKGFEASFSNLFGERLILTQKGKDYSGSYYGPEGKRGDIITVRGIPGVAYQDGRFESLF